MVSECEELRRGRGDIKECRDTAKAMEISSKQQQKQLARGDREECRDTARAMEISSTTTTS